MKTDATVSLFQYWNRLRAGRKAPRRHEVEPADIRTLLADTFILERDGRGEAVFRLAGTRLCGQHGRELKGYAFASLWRARDQRLVSKLVQNVFAARGVVALDFVGSSQKGRSCSFEMLLLPLDGTDNARSLGIASPLERPFWLGADAIVQAQLNFFRLFDPDREPLFLANRPAVEAPALAPADLAPEDDPAPPARRVRHLLVLKGGRSDPT